MHSRLTRRQMLRTSLAAWPSLSLLPSSSSILRIRRAQRHPIPHLRNSFAMTFPDCLRAGLVGTRRALNTAIQEFHWIPSRALPRGAWSNGVVNRDAWLVLSEDGKSYIQQQLFHPPDHVNAVLIAGDPEWSDYTVEVKVKPLLLEGIARDCLPLPDEPAVLRVRTHRGQHGSTPVAASHRGEDSCSPIVGDGRRASSCFLTRRSNTMFSALKIGGRKSALISMTTSCWKRRTRDWRREKRASVPPCRRASKTFAWRFPKQCAPRSRDGFAGVARTTSLQEEIRSSFIWKKLRQRDLAPAATYALAIWTATKHSAGDADWPEHPHRCA